MPDSSQPPVWNDYCDLDDLKHALGEDFDISNRGEFPMNSVGVLGEELGPMSKPVAYIEIPEFRTVAILPTQDMLALEQLNVGNQRILDAASSGATVGTASGLASGLVLCGTTGPFAGLCISGLVSAGGLSGGVGGLIYGAIAADEGVEAKEINHNLARLGSSYNLQDEIFARLTVKVPQEAKRPSGTADILVSPTVARIGVELSEKGSLNLQMWSNLIFTWKKGDEEYYGRAHFSYTSADSPIEDWNANDGELYRTAILAGLDSMSMAMATRITSRLQKGEETLTIERYPGKGAPQRNTSSVK
ncbi:MAG: hypothetical protein ABJ013_04185 [Halioglobus sp.]